MFKHWILALDQSTICKYLDFSRKIEKRTITIKTKHIGKHEVDNVINHRGSSSNNLEEPGKKRDGTRNP